MSKVSIQKMSCPKCGAEQEIKIWESINVNLDIDVKERILINDFFNHKCKSCSEIFVLNYPCLYNDSEKKVMIYLLPAFNRNNEKDISALNNITEELDLNMTRNYKLRVVTTINSLMEKILIEEEKLDDRIIEVLKVIQYTMFMEKFTDVDVRDILFKVDSSDSYKLAFFLSDGRIANIPISKEMIEYISKEHLEDIKIKTKNTFEIIDTKWAVEVLS